VELRWLYQGAAIVVYAFATDQSNPTCGALYTLRGENILRDGPPTTCIITA